MRIGYNTLALAFSGGTMAAGQDHFLVVAEGSG